MPSKPFIRREVRTPHSIDKALPAYARAVAAMQERSRKDPKDPTGWSYQAAMHGTTLKPEQKLWNGCKHYSWWFLAWHRMYVYFFEQIVRAAVIETGGPKDWALPYWNYGLGGENAAIPDAFRNPHEPNGARNPLYVEQRAPGINQGARLRSQYTTPEFALSRPHFVGPPEFGGGIAPPRPQFSKFTGRLEQTPHNDVHNALGGWMQNPFQAAQDPIFWLHHTNIDRIWVEWGAKGHVDPENAEWLGHGFEFFDASGKVVSLSPGEVLDTLKLDYVYDHKPAAEPILEPMPTPSPEEPKVVAATAAGMTLVGSSAAIKVGIDQKARREVLDTTRKTDPRRLFLNIEEIEAEVNPGSVYGIYVNLPENADEETEEAHHVGNVSFFGIERTREPSDDEPPHSVTVSIEIGERLRELNGGQPWGDEQVDVTLLPLSLIPPEGAGEGLRAELESTAEDPPVKIGRVSLSIA